MKVRFKITTALLASIRNDLQRRHPLAHERVGFISAGLSACGSDLLVLARGYRPVRDDEYLRDPSVGAMMGADAIRGALQWAMQDGVALFHVHTHGGRGIPSFSPIDLRENSKFVPDLLKVAPQRAHGAIVLSDTAGQGLVWFDRSQSPHVIASFVEVGAPLRKWSVV
ncbi:MAG: hypothetical protein OXU42_08945 [Deltaproteobacteria bacterium]|nr:hypothetical protein [Deltaproteobacteria bacterium]